MPTWINLLISSLLPFLVTAGTIYAGWSKAKSAEKKNASKEKADEFLVLIQANSDLRKELDADKRELKEENKVLRIDLNLEKEKTNEMRKTIQEHTIKIEYLTNLEGVCKERLEIAMNKIGELEERLENKN